MVIQIRKVINTNLRYNTHIQYIKKNKTILRTKICMKFEFYFIHLNHV